ncbi:TetR/AcrR family transcriptional regulator [Nocardia asteroides]|uniref:TetR/AcrR family transcriptional regulator n=1 Tax=Nocardia asteroides TaxID=1824 RepID=UPI00365979B6
MTAQDRREQILDSTHAIVTAEGFHAATPNRIATAAGITRPVLYQQFGDLPGLFVALIDREQQRAGRQFAEAIAQHADPAETDRFVNAFTAMLHAVDAYPNTWRLFLFPPEGAPPELSQRLAESQEIVQRFFRAELEQAFPDLPDPEYTARIVQAAIRELLQLRLSDPEHATVARLGALIRQIRARIVPG